MAEKAERVGRGRSVKELLLFHGTDSIDTVRGIAINNFDHRLSGKNATIYGEGAYFATNAKYSHGYTKPPERFMFLARVLVGEYTKGESSYKRPPSKPGAAHELYDSCVDNITNPSIYIVFDTKQYYPEFLIQYHTKVESIAPKPKPVTTAQPVITAKPVIHAKPAVAAKPSPASYPSSPVTYASSSVSYPIGSSSVSYPTSSVVSTQSGTQIGSPIRSGNAGGQTLPPSLPSLVVHSGSSPPLTKRRAPSPPPILNPQHTSAYPSSMSSPVRQATMSGLSAIKSTQSTPKRGRNKDKCVVQ